MDGTGGIKRNPVESVYMYEGRVNGSGERVMTQDSSLYTITGNVILVMESMTQPCYTQCSGIQGHIITAP